jgi:hypothetical protein
MSRELCLSCGAVLRYRTDGIGRVVGQCTACARAFARSTVQVTPPMRGAYFRAGPWRGNASTARIEQVLASQPGPHTMATLITLSGLGQAVVRESVRRLRVAGRVRMVPFGQGRNYQRYYESTIYNRTGVAC